MLKSCPSSWISVGLLICALFLASVGIHDWLVTPVPAVVVIDAAAGQDLHGEPGKPMVVRIPIQNRSDRIITIVGLEDC